MLFFVIVLISDFLEVFPSMTINPIYVIIMPNSRLESGWKVLSMWVGHFNLEFHCRMICSSSSLVTLTLISLENSCWTRFPRGDYFNHLTWMLALVTFSSFLYFAISNFLYLADGEKTWLGLFEIITIKSWVTA